MELHLLLSFPLWGKGSISLPLPWGPHLAEAEDEGGWGKEEEREFMLLQGPTAHQAPCGQYLMDSTQQPCEAGAVIIPIFQMRRLRLRGVQAELLVSSRAGSGGRSV